MLTAFRTTRTLALGSLSKPTRVLKQNLHTSAPRHEHFLNVNADAFKKRVIDNQPEKPILVDFFATWCQPCRLLTPVLKNMTGTDSGFDLMTIDVDEYPELASEYKISSLPTVVAFKNGKVASNFVGVLREAQIKTFLEKVSSSA